MDKHQEKQSENSKGFQYLQDTFDHPKNKVMAKFYDKKTDFDDLNQHCNDTLNMINQEILTKQE